ncbi:hypothetical protein QTP86_013866 [Hemibagrus guttatus]|nr:hypothetical protein QTP86_013866 [Hemibagrus guttatus]
MHSDTVEKSASPRKRIVSRAMSEEESLRHIIEAEDSPKRLTRRDSRYGSLRRGDTRGSQELEREREQRRKLENDVALLMQELEQLKEEKISVPTESIIQEQKEAAVITDNSDADDVDGCESNEIKSEDTPSQPTVPTNSFANFAAAAYLLFKNRRFEPVLSKQSAADGTSVDEEVKNTHVVGSEGSSRKSHDGEEYDESSGYEDAPSDFSPSTPDGSSDAVLPEDGESELKNSNEARNARDPDACLLS